ncbi:MAG: hypothetical protein M1822_008452 [Bathelium mastoideum]|nr:MAG: hypothetical protein M1822_008452 [Bathelium mastoideum]
MGFLGEAVVWVSEEDTVSVDHWPEIICYTLAFSPLTVQRVENRNNGSIERSEARPAPGTQQRDWWKPVDHDLAVTLDEIGKHYAHMLLAKPPCPEESILFFWASTASFKTLIQYEKASRRYWRSILDSNYNAVGRFELHIRDPDSNTITRDIMGPHVPETNQFVVLGSRTFGDAKPVLDVMQIQWDDGLAYRVGTGFIDESAWVEAGPFWKLIALG